MPDIRPIVELDPCFFLRPNNFPRADRRVDFFLCGAPSLLLPVVPVGASLTVEYLRVLEGLVRRGEVLCGEVLCGGVLARAGGLPDGGGGGGCEGGSGLSPCTGVSPPRLAEAPIVTELACGGNVCWSSSWGSCCSCCCCCCCCWTRSETDSSGNGVMLAMLVPGLRIGNSSSFTAVAKLDPPELRMGNSSSIGLAIGIGPDILPRMDAWAVAGRRVLGLDFQRLGMVSLSPTYKINGEVRPGGGEEKRRGVGDGSGGGGGDG